MTDSPETTGVTKTDRRWSRRRKVVAAVVGTLLAGGGAFATTNWIVGLGSGSSGEAQSAAVTNLTITAVASPSATNLLYPGGNGDVVVTIANPNPFPVTVTGVDLPTNTTYAGGFTTAALSTAQTGCSTTTSDVIWNYSSTTSGSVHTFNSAVTVGAAGSLAVTFTNDASMTLSAPSACEATFFSMPSLTGVAATGGAGLATTGSVTDAWTS
ncbi:MAG: hypothetical protein ACYC1D_07575 [Acidimicrobiales bacterium]